MKRIITILFILILTSTTAYAHPWLESIEIVKKADCSGVTKEGLCCWDTDDDKFCCGSGSACVDSVEGTDFGTLTDGRLCTYDATGTEIDCDTTNAPTATALAANGANCAAGQAPLGVNASGAAETCTDFEEDLSNSAGLAGALSDETGTGNAVFSASPTFTGILTMPAGLVSAPSIVSDDADSGFYFGSKGFNWAVDGAKIFGVDFVGAITASGDSDFISGLKTSTLRARVDNATLVLQTRVFSAADNMIEMASGTTTFSGFDGEIAGVTIKPTAGILDAGDTLTVLQLAPVSTVDHTGGTLRGIAFGNITGDADAAEYMIDMQATGYDYLIYDDKFNVDNSGIVGVASADVSGTPIAATRATKTWSFTYAAGDDTDGVCDLSGGQADCFTIPDPTTHGKLTCFIKGTENLLCDYLIGSAGETVEVNDPLTKCSATDTCTDGAQDTICIYDAGSNAVVHNDMGQAETITCTLTYD